MNPLFLLPISVLFITAVTLRIIHRSWFSPGAFYPLAWCFFMLLPLVFVPQFNVYPLGLWVVTALAVSFSLGALLAHVDPDQLPDNQLHNNDAIFHYRHVIYNGTIVMTALTLVGVVLLLRYSIALFQLNYSLFSLMALPSNITAERFNELLVYPLYLKFFLYFLYPAVLLAGLGFASAANKKQMILYLTPLLVAVLKGTLETTRSTILLAVIVWLAGFIGGRVLARDQLHRLINKKLFLFSSISSLAFLALFIGLQWLRDAGGEILFSALMERIQVYFFGYLSAFTTWLEHSPVQDLTLGMTTLSGPFNFIGLIERKLGFYTHTYINQYASTNVYTALRGLIHDFTVLGALPIMAGVGFLSTVAYCKSLQGRIFWLLPLTMVYAFTLYSPLISIFNYNSVILAWVIVFALLLLIPRKNMSAP